MSREDRCGRRDFAHHPPGSNTGRPAPWACGTRPRLKALRLQSGASAVAVRIRETLLITLDAAGLTLFAMAGTAKALDAHVHPFSAVLLGTLTAVGGGTLRDVLLGQVPRILRVDAILARSGLPRSQIRTTRRFCRTRLNRLLLDHGGRLWAARQNGLDRYNPLSGWVASYSQKDGLQARDSKTKLNGVLISLSSPILCRACPQLLQLL